MDRKQFLENRRKFIGGSDIAHALGVGPYACKRKLFFDKTGREPDVDISNKPDLRRGRRLEPVAAEYYVDVTKRLINEVDQIVSKDHPNCGVSMDRIVFDDNKPGNGYLEIKVVKSAYPIKRSGLYEGYILQVQFGMAVANLKWGSYAIYAPNDDELLHWDFDADEALGKQLLKEVQEFWDTYIHTRIAPPPLPPESKPCEECEFRISCPSFENEDLITL